MTAPEAIEVLRHNGRSFHFASHLLTQTQRDRAACLYAFCRWVDDLADESSDPDQAWTQLQQIKAAIVRRQSNHALITSMLGLMHETGMPADPVLSLIDGVASDLQGPEIQTEADLLNYAYQVAGTVGIMMSMVLDVTDRRALPFAVDLGIGMQLTNIARDVGEDARKGRIYLPAQWLGPCKAQDIPTPAGDLAIRLQSATKQMIELSGVYFDSGLAGIAYLPPRARWAIVVAAKVYREIGQVVRKSHYRAWDQRAVVSLPRKLVCATSALSRYTFSLKPSTDTLKHDPALHHDLQDHFGTDKPISP